MTDLEKAAQEWSNDNKNLFVCTATYHSCVNAFMAGADWQAKQWRCETCNWWKGKNLPNEYYSQICVNELGPLAYKETKADFGCVLHEEKEVEK